MVWGWGWECHICLLNPGLPLSWALSFWYGTQWKFVRLVEASVGTAIHNYALSIGVKGKTYLRNAGYSSEKLFVLMLQMRKASAAQE